MDPRSIKAVIFDLDGTLLDTIQDIGASANAALREFGYPEHPIDDYRNYVGNGIRNLLRLALPVDIGEAEFSAVLRFYQGYYPAHCTDLTEYFPGIQQMMDTIADAGYALGILSNKTEATTLQMIAHYFPKTPFRFVWGNNGERPLKPDVASAKLACKALGLGPGAILFCGDGDTDMEFANRAGFLPVGCSWGYRSPVQLQEAGAWRILEEARELLELLRIQ